MIWISVTSFQLENDYDDSFSYDDDADDDDDDQDEDDDVFEGDYGLTSLFDDDYSDSEESQDHDCPNNQVWNECGTACPLQCGEDRPEWCTYNCVIGCACPDNMWMTNDGNCVAEQDCPEQNQYHPCDFETPVCQNNGQCMRNGDDYYCDCFAPWSGQHCDVVADPMSDVSVVNIMQQSSPCDSQPCMNGGTCIRSGLSNDYECFCASGFNGGNCENNYADENQQWNNQNQQQNNENQQQQNQNNNQNQQNNRKQEFVYLHYHVEFFHHRHMSILLCLTVPQLSHKYQHEILPIHNLEL
jgi:hypothetical protein